jgi:hypothetical protein
LRKIYSKNLKKILKANKLKKRKKKELLILLSVLKILLKRPTNSKKKSLSWMLKNKKRRWFDTKKRFLRSIWQSKPKMML